MSSLDSSDLLDFLSTALENPLAQQVSDGRLLASVNEAGEPLDPSIAESTAIPIHRIILLARAPALSQQLNLHIKTGDFILPGVNPEALITLVHFLYLQPIIKATQN